jgi:hypothetical protein
MTTTAKPATKVIDSETYSAVDRTAHHVSEMLHAFCNEPSLGLYYVQDNIRTTVPKLVEAKRRMHRERETIENSTYGIDASLGIVKGLSGITTFAAIIERARGAQTTAELIVRRKAEAKKAAKLRLQQPQ